MANNGATTKNGAMAKTLPCLILPQPQRKILEICGFQGVMTRNRVAHEASKHPQLCTSMHGHALVQGHARTIMDGHVQLCMDAQSCTHDYASTDMNAWLCTVIQGYACVWTVVLDARSCTHGYACRAIGGYALFIIRTCTTVRGQTSCRMLVL